MKNIKINKLAKNRLNEKEMRSLKGGDWITNYGYGVACDKNNPTNCCESVCACTFHPPLLDPTESSAAGDSGSAMRMNSLA